MQKTTQPKPAPNQKSIREPMQSFDAVRAIWSRGLRAAGRLLLGAAAVLLSGGLLGLPILSAQQPATAQKPASSQPSAQKPSHASAAHRHTAQRTTAPRTAARRSPAKRSPAKRGSRRPSPVEMASAAPAVPPMPDWPANRQPNQATVVWDSHGLEIKASNSSLDQILHEVATDTGANVEGFNKDQRIFGTYGPGPAREVLSSLLDGSGYNVIMVGGAGDQPPQQIVLSTMAALPPPGANANSGPNNIEQQDAQERQEDSGQPQPGFPMPPHSSQPVQQQMQEKMQEKMQQEMQMLQRQQLRDQEPE